MFNSDQRGERLFLEVVDDELQPDSAEVVFENGDCQVVDFAEKTHPRGLFPLLDFKDGRRVGHVRLIARSRTEDAEVALFMQKWCGHPPASGVQHKAARESGCLFFHD